MAASQDKGKAKETAKSLDNEKDTSTGSANATSAGPVIGGSRGDWTAVWNAE